MLIRSNMLKNTIKKVTLTTAITAALLVTGCSSVDSTSDSVKARQDTMKSWSDAKNVMGDMIDNHHAFDQAAFRDQANYLASDTETVWQHFDKEEGSSSASPTIWTDSAAWQEEVEKFNAAATSLSAAAAGDFTAQAVAMPFDNVAKSCKSCHTSFKLKKAD